MRGTCLRMPLLAVAHSEHKVLTTKDVQWHPLVSYEEWDETQDARQSRANTFMHAYETHRQKRNINTTQISIKSCIHVYIVHIQHGYKCIQSLILYLRIVFDKFYPQFTGS